MELENQTPDELKYQKRLFSIFFPKKVQPIPSDEERKQYPEFKSNPISQMMFYWLNPVIKSGFNRTAHHNDCFTLKDTSESMDYYYDCFKNKLNELTSQKDNLNETNVVTWIMILIALYHTFMFDINMNMLLKAVSDISNSVSPLLLKKLTDFVENSDIVKQKIGSGVGYAIGCALLVFINGVSINYSFYRGTNCGAKARSVLIKLVLEKSFTIDAEGKHKFPNGKINSIMSTDLNRIDRVFTLASFTLLFPIPLGITIALLIVNIGVSALAGIGCYVLMFFLIGYAFTSLASLRVLASKCTDQRVKLTTEFLSNFRMVKFYNWESYYENSIIDARTREMKYTMQMQTIKNILMAFSMSLPNLAAMVAFLTVSKVSPDKSSGSIFASLSLFQSLSIVFFVLPQSISAIASGKVGLKRVAEFMSCNDVNENFFKIDNLNDSQYAVNVNNCDFEWEIFNNENDNENDNIMDKKNENDIEKIETKISSEISTDTTETSSKRNFDSLKDINFKVKKGEFIIIAGGVGSGKTSLLLALSGFMKRTKGSVSINGSNILCGAPWIKNDSIRNNILFGKEYDEQKYTEIIKACSLDNDFKQIIAGDNCEVGERGITLSGGQKARVNLARAIYADTDVILLDDVLSAVDSKVGKHIVNECICGILKSKTVILATHQIGLIEKADRLVFMNGDGTCEVGKIDELNESFPQIKEFFNTVAKNPTDNEDKELNEKKIKKNIDNNKVAANNQTVNNDNVVKIIGDEERAVNSLGFDVYKAYYEYGVGILKLVFIPLFLSLIIATTFSNIFSNTWLSFWLTDKFKGKSYGFYVGIYIMFNFLYVIFTCIEFAVIGYFTVTASRKLNIGAMKRVLTAPVVFMDISPLGRVLNRFTKDTDVLDNEIADQFLLVVYPIGMVVGTLILCIIYLPWFAIAIPGLVFLYVFLTAYYQATNRELKRIDAVTRSFVYTHFNETIEGMLTIKAFGRENYFFNKLNDLIDNNNDVYFLTWAIQRWLGQQFGVVTFGFLILISFLCCFRVFNISAASTGLLLTYAMNVPPMLSLCVRCLAQIETEFNAVERLNFYSSKLIQESPFEIPETEPEPNWPTSGKIEFDSVSLKYRPELPYALKNLNMKINSAEKVGFCGRTGAGKSTFMTCLYRLTEFEGLIKIDGIDISKIGLNRLRKSLSIIPQDPVLFNGTIRTNIDPTSEYDDDTLWNALKIAGLIENVSTVRDELVVKGKSHKFHLDNEVDDNGSNYSLGEKQLIALCRALVKRTKILILDEATSSVDYKTDERIQNIISNHFKECTVLSIAHRLNTILDFDKIAVMDAGRVVQFDEPKVLFEDESGIFRELCNQANIDISSFK